MAVVFKQPSPFTLTPHKVSLCVLLQFYSPPVTPDHGHVPFPFASVPHHNRLGLFLLALTKACDDILEPRLDQLVTQLREIDAPQNHWVTDNLIARLSSFSAPDDLFNLFSDLRGILPVPDGNLDEEQIILDPSSSLGLFLRRCILAFNLLSFEGVCHLLTNLETYSKDYVSTSPSYQFHRLNGSSNDLEPLLEYENMDLENMVFEKVSEETKARKRAREVPFHIHAPKAILGLLEDVELSTDLELIHGKGKEIRLFANPPNDAVGGLHPNSETFLRTIWQIQGYLMEQADAIEKQKCCFSSKAFESILRQLQKFAPELHRVHFLHYLNNLYHDDYPAALENLHRYFDYSAGEEGLDFVPPSSAYGTFGRLEIALLCFGMMHFHFGHPRQGLEVLTEAVRVSQQNRDDACVAYTLAAISNMLSEFGISSAAGILGSSSHVNSIGPSLSIQQQLFVLLRRSLRRAESLNLKRLVASNHLAMAKFDLTHVQRPLLSFGPKASMRLRTRPVNVCKELRLSSHLISEFGAESSTMTIDGAFATAWLKNLRKPPGSLVLSQENGSEYCSTAFDFCAQPSSIPNSVMQSVGSSYLLRATAWEIYGSAPLARINALVYLTCFSDSSSSADVALSYVKLIQHLAVFKGYKEAFAALKIAEEKFFSLSKSRIQMLKLQLLHERALHLGNLKLAYELCDELGALASPVTGVDMELKTEAKLRRARTLLAAKQFSQAAEIAHSLFCMCYKFNMQVENATVLLLLAEIHKNAGNAVLGLPYALASLSFCQSFNLDLLKASATLTLAELWLSLGSNHAKRALVLIHGAFAMILGHGGLELRARANIAEAKCYLSDSTFSVYEDPNVVLDPLRQASEALEILEYHELAAEAFYLIAVVSDKLRNLEEREIAAASFKKHVLALEHPQDNDGPLNLLS